MNFLMEQKGCKKESTMSKKFFATVSSLIMAFMLSMPCFAAEKVEATANAPVLEEADSTSLVLNIDGSPSTRSGNISDFKNGTTTGYIGGTFTVPASESNSLIKVHWKAQPLNGANGSAVFKMNVSGISNPILLYTGSSQTASIGNLPAGTYSFSISPHTNVSGSYFYGLQFYAF